MDAAVNQIASLFSDGMPLVAFANDWAGDPTSKHHIMRTYAGYTNVAWVEASGMRRPSMTSTHDRSRILARVKRGLEGPRPAGDGLRVLSPLSLPLPGNRLAEALNRRVYSWSVGRALRQLHPRRDPLYWVYIPTTAPYLSAFRKRRGLVYHCVDRWWSFSDYDPRVMRACHEQLCREADVVFASSLELLDDCQRYSERAHLIRHGVEWEYFSRAAFEEMPRPADIADINGPILGFFGLIHDWVDQELICHVADAFPEATVVLIGKVQVEAALLATRPNIRLLGQKPYSELAGYAAAFDIGLIPFVLNDLTLAVNPIKLREYLSAGMPVVATALPEIEIYSEHPMVRTGRTAEEQIEGIRYFLNAGLTRKNRREAALNMADESWLGRCGDMARLIQQYT